ncbi:hypothetical protein F4560_008133 [Saccharothrix ecbatanensis]|uniref:Uncharacterized protein n=1 Tax=Saccharothrix ecbatanensis TaxID=1105145 RepID=A0A7W9HTT5_9PSEU|nr:hypothetical protein [Saccharothrix ecbatanensis]MBB5808365.1 hypothetical protein [Saccharothrix ecbatanensis]
MGTTRYTYLTHPASTRDVIVLRTGAMECYQVRRRDQMPSDNAAHSPDKFTSFLGHEPTSLPNFIAPISNNATYFDGTAIRAIASRFVQRADGLIIPEYLAQGPAPIDQILVYLTTREIFGFDVPETYIRGELGRINVEPVLAFVAEVMARLRSPGISRTEVDEHYVNLWFKGEARTKILNLLKDPLKGFIVPQALLALAQQAMLYCGKDLSANKPANLVAVYLAATDHLTKEEDYPSELKISEVPGSLGRELISNQVFNADVDEAHTLTRFIRTWLQLSKEQFETKEVFDLEAAYLRATDTPLRDVLAVGLALRAATMNGPHIISPTYLSGLGWTTERISKALAPFTIDIHVLRQYTCSQSDFAATSWSFDSFSRYPVVRDHEGAMVVLDPNLLMKRIFGWLPLFDVKFALQSTGTSEDKKYASRVENCVRRLAEIYAAEILDSLTGSSAMSRRTYHDRELRAAYSAPGIKIADAAIDYGDSWVVAEVTTIQLRRESVTGMSDEAVISDIDKLVEEVAQIDATISSLREYEEKLTGLPPSGVRRRYFPLLILTEGFPVNPISLPLLRDRVGKRGLLAEGDVMPLEIADLQELEIIEGLQENGGQSLKEILDKKSNANLRNMQIRDFLLSELHLSPSRPSRVKKLYHESFKSMVGHMYPTMKNLELPDIEQPE